MELKEQYIGKDVVKHFAGLINDVPIQKQTIYVAGDDIFQTIKKYGLDKLIESKIELISLFQLMPKEITQTFYAKIHSFAKTEKAIVTVDQQSMTYKVNNIGLDDLQKQGFDIRHVKNILDAMIVASKKRRNKVLFITTGLEDKALVTAAGLAKAKTVGFRNFFVLQQHFNTPELINHYASLTPAAGFILSIKTGINTVLNQYTGTPSIYGKSVIFSGYQPEEIMQSIFMVMDQFVSKQPKVKFQRAMKIPDENIARARWMLEEVFDTTPLTLPDGASIKNGKLIINEKYNSFEPT